ncbi:MULTISPECIES: histidine kinase [Streptomyces]|uniref:histidine kinase n=1 Tax=Streptomyces venezuelae (strain ATCC 10712 / CBS 650.69 / DSM 40230 / JCM 4526 / NBRC 13096 / PD 04745) TaxID=953739 RepID=F2RAK6_STRVP|nr:histidine kinase [Streptomyces venezuelae]APE22499.1 two-component sensor histidine kinase [Streptomyces venezuelae]QER99882.1 two-component sensor histidine kinase [Streptomyces venezuelae ATCC 10712]CCA56688.1 putative two-component system sensor kinase [Streptomyces venezuelae ATCC 10712]
MDRVTQTQTPETSRSPEIRLVQVALGGLRQELFHDAFAYRPLPRKDVNSGVTRFLPQRIREYAGLLPHATVAFAALIVFLIGGERTHGSFGPVALVFTCVPAAIVLLTLVRPVLAFWASVCSAPFVAYIGGFGSGWPFSAASFAAHLAVLAVVAARTRPRTAAWMWIVTAGYCAFAELFLGRGGGTDAFPMVFVSALVLLTVSIFQVRRQADREVTAQLTVTEQERSRRTLLEERTTIARELHDVVAHHMSVVAIQAEAAPYRVENPPPELEQAFLTIRENAVAALTELRRILGVVRAEDYEAPDAPQPTLADLDSLVRNVAEAGLVVEKTVTGAVRELPQGVELSAYRIVQEALSNVLRHAPGATAKVEVSYVLGGLGLRIANGPARGLVKPSPGAGHGITGMRERVTMLGGEMTAEPTEDGGYEVAAFVPVSRDRDEERGRDRDREESAQ